MLCVLVGKGRFSGGVDRPAGPDGNPPAEIEIESPRRFRRTDPRRGDLYAVDVSVWRHDGETGDGEPRYVLDRTYTDERAG